MKPTAVVLTTLVVALVTACNTGPTETQPATPRAPQEPAVAPAPVVSPTAPVPAIAPASAPIPSATPSPAPPVMPVVPPGVTPLVAAVDWLGTLSEVTPAHVEAAFPEHVIRDNGLEGYYVSKDGHDVVFVAVVDHRLVQASPSDITLTVDGIRRGERFSVVTARPDTACRFESGEDCSVHCRLPSGWVFLTSIRCVPLAFTALSLAKAKTLTRSKEVESIYWSNATE